MSKGSRNRTTDQKSYADNYELYKRNMEKKKKPVCGLCKKQFNDVVDMEYDWTYCDGFVHSECLSKKENQDEVSN